MRKGEGRRYDKNMRARNNEKTARQRKLDRKKQGRGRKEKLVEEEKRETRECGG